jgi:hypothetical protein
MTCLLAYETVFNGKQPLASSRSWADGCSCDLVHVVLLYSHQPCLMHYTALHSTTKTSAHQTKCVKKVWSSENA